MMDRHLSIEGKMRGEAEFVPVGETLLYEERGRLAFGAHDAPAEQRYIFDFTANATRANVKFRDGRPFHSLDLSRGETFVSHICGPDLYEGHFRALGATSWQSAWKITGPRKDQDILTLYSRIE